MKLRRLTPLNIVEVIFGALIPTLLFAPLCLFGLWTGLRVQLDFIYLLVYSVFPLLALVTLWTVLLVGPQAVMRKPVFRWYAVLSLLAGVGCTIWYALVSPALYLLDSELSWKYFFSGQMFLSLGPILVGLRYSWLLIRGADGVRG